MSVYGCHSKPRYGGYWAREIVRISSGEPPQDGWRFIADTMSRECRYDRQREDAKCGGCSRITTNE
jgi:hypothetical protein